jgi:hypothetical protein
MAQRLQRSRELRHNPARVTNMKKQTLEVNYAHGHHCWWLRELHRVEHTYKKNGEEMSYEKRKETVDRAIRSAPNLASSIVCCEVCQNEIAECAFDGRDFFDTGFAVRPLLEQYGIRLKPSATKSNRTTQDFSHA